MRRRVARDGRCVRTGKVRFRDRASAVRSMRIVAESPSPSGVKPVRAYRCPECGGWHLTSQAGGG